MTSSRHTPPPSTELASTAWPPSRRIEEPHEDHFGDEFGPIRSVDVSFVGEGQLDIQCLDGDVVDVDMEGNPNSKVEYEIVEEEEEHEELGGLAFESEVVDPALEQGGR
ncbi:hypothetical protein NL676_014389 [Syzygium grande]|nr:hypothetical protein NL676_014389 [Syzygium grande]